VLLAPLLQKNSVSNEIIAINSQSNDGKFINLGNE
jgi:hypothetical protein